MCTAPSIRFMFPSFAIWSNFSFTIFMHLHRRMTFPFLGTSNGLSRFCKRSTTASRHQICWNLLCCFVLRKNWARCASVEITYPELNIKDGAELFSNFLYLSKQQKLCNQKHFYQACRLHEIYCTVNFSVFICQ